LVTFPAASRSWQSSEPHQTNCLKSIVAPVPSFSAIRMRCPRPSVSELSAARDCTVNIFFHGNETVGSIPKIGVRGRALNHGEKVAVEVIGEAFGNEAVGGGSGSN